MRDTARTRFLAELGEGRRREVLGDDGWSSRLEAVLGLGARELDPSWVTEDDLAAELGQRLEAATDPAEVWWNHLNPGELFLALACARGVPEAIEKLESLHGTELAAAAKRFARPGLGADDLLQMLRKKLYLAEGVADEPGHRPKIASYTGQGQLRSWLRVTATRTFIDAVRSVDAKSETPIADEIVAMLPGSGADPELELLKRQNLVEFKAAFAEAVASLDGSDRLVLRQALIDRLSIDQIAALYHVHRATAARRVVKAREALLGATREAMARRLGLAPTDLDSVLALIASRMEASVERLLRA